MKFRNPYNYDTTAASKAVALDTSGDPMITQQHMRDECDINTIVQRFIRTGQIPEGTDFADIDVSDVGDYQDALNMIREADEQFMNLPSAIRDRFRNDPARLLEFVYNPANQDEAVKLGLVKPVSEPETAPAPAPEPPPAHDPT